MQIAVRQKNSPGTALAADGRFFAEMQVEIGNRKLFRGAAYTLPLASVNCTGVRTHAAWTPQRLKNF